MRAVRSLRRERLRKMKPATLNLVSLMDIFTILVFFLMFNSGDVEILKATKDITLPESVAEKKPEERLLISVNEDDLIVNGHAVASITAVMSSKNKSIAGLKKVLLAEADAQKKILPAGSEFDGAVTIMGDRGLPYELLKRIMLTCQQTQYTKIALAVVQVAGAQASE